MSGFPYIYPTSNKEIDVKQRISMGNEFYKAGVEVILSLLGDADAGIYLKRRKFGVDILKYDVDHGQ